MTITDTTSGSVPYSTKGQTRIWTYSYTPSAGSVPAGFLASIDAPRTDVSDVTTFGYDASGNLTSVTNALSQVSQITSCDSNGHPLTVVDPNGVTRNLACNDRGWLTSVGVVTAGGTATTTIDYDDAGQVIKITHPDGSYLAYSYDDAHAKGATPGATFPAVSQWVSIHAPAKGATPRWQI